MSCTYLIVKSMFPTQGIEEPFEFDADPVFKAGDYRSLSLQLFPEAAWNGMEGWSNSTDGDIELQATDAGLVLTYEIDELSADTVRSLALFALSSGAVLMNAGTTEIIGPA